MSSQVGDEIVIDAMMPTDPVDMNNSSGPEMQAANEKETKKVTTRKRKQYPENHQRAVCKKLRNHGSEYVNSSGKVIKQKAVGPSCLCRKRCMQTLTERH